MSPNGYQEQLLAGVRGGEWDHACEGVRGVAKTHTEARITLKTNKFILATVEHGHALKF